MTTQELEREGLVTDIEQEIVVGAPIEKVFRGVIDQLTRLSTGANNEPMPMKLEERPGGRWFRDLGNDTGHLWGFVQSIKPPTLLEIHGPLMMSFAVANNLIIRLEETGAGARIKLRHQVLGAIPAEYGDGMDEGWRQILESVKKAVEG